MVDYKAQEESVIRTQYKKLSAYALRKVAGTTTSWNDEVARVLFALGYKRGDN